MSSDIKRYGTSDLDGGYHLVRQWNGMSNDQNVATFYIDGLGQATRVGRAVPGRWRPEDIAKLPTLEEATNRQLAPAFAEAEANAKAFAANRPKDAEPPAPVDTANVQFYSFR